MEQAKQAVVQGAAKEKKLKIALSIMAILLVLVMAWLLIVKNSGAWLRDQGEWSHARYTVGRIDYIYELNDKAIDLEDNLLQAAVPIIGAVKLNDQQMESNAPNYEAYADANFNEGVTVAHIKIVNKSSFPIQLTYELVFEKLFDDAMDSQNVFYLILPQGTAVNTAQKELTLKGANSAQTYKNYIQSIMAGAQSYADMKAALMAYYESTAAQDLKNGVVKMNREDTWIIDILFWSEYNTLLPFVTTDSQGAEQLNPDYTPSALQGLFTMKISSAQQENSKR